MAARSAVVRVAHRVGTEGLHVAEVHVGIATQLVSQYEVRPGQHDPRAIAALRQRKQAVAPLDTKHGAAAEEERDVGAE